MALAAEQLPLGRRPLQICGLRSRAPPLPLPRFPLGMVVPPFPENGAEAFKSERRSGDAFEAALPFSSFDPLIPPFLFPFPFKAPRASWVAHDGQECHPHPLLLPVGASSFDPDRATRLPTRLPFADCLDPAPPPYLQLAGLLFGWEQSVISGLMIMDDFQRRFGTCDAAGVCEISSSRQSYVQRRVFEPPGLFTDASVTSTSRVITGIFSVGCFVGALSSGWISCVSFKP